MASVFLRLVFQGWFRCGGAEGRDAWPAAPKREADSEEKAGGGKKANRDHPRPPGWCLRLVKGSMMSVSSAEGDRRTAAEVGGADGPKPVSAAANPARGASGGGGGAGEFCAAQLHHGSAPRPEQGPAGPGQLREPQADLRLAPSLQAQVSTSTQKFCM